jgi:chemosensory pili system protein ChpC
MNTHTATEVRSVLIPLVNSRLLLPNAVVAEVVDYEAPMKRDDVPDWFLGDLLWRGIRVPMISFERLLGQEFIEPGKRGRCIVLNTLNGDEALTHITLVSQQIPSLIRVTAESVSEPIERQAEPSDSVAMSVDINNTLALIPDFDLLEQKVKEAG